jgi:XTP/dITP diphosphohydrolase
LAAEFLLATRSTDKLREIVEILAPVSATTLSTLSDLKIAPSPAEDDVENHETFVANALAKARYFARLTGQATLADDSGLMVDALHGKPGVRTKRFAADHGHTGGDVDQANNDLLLHLLRDTPDSERIARYVCAAAVVFPDGTAITTTGTCRGVITRERRGTGGFGYDPLFFIPELNATFAELTPSEKHARSHRALAFRALIPHLKFTAPRR